MTPSPGTHAPRPAVCLAVAAVVLAAGLRGAPVPVPVPNGSFELPSTVFVSTDIEVWQKSPEPPDYDPGGGPWFQKAGIFKNTAPGRPDHIPNLDGAQALYLFAVPEVGVSMDATGDDGIFPARYQPGDVWTLTVAIIGGGGNMPEGARLRVELGYLDAGGGRHLLAGTEVVHSAAQFPTTTQFLDFSVTTPVVTAADPWAGRRLSLNLVATGSEFIGGYWDLDNVRLTVERAEHFRVAVVPGDSGMRVSWPGAAGISYRVERSADLKDWSLVGDPVQGAGGELQVELPVAGSGPLFVRVVSGASF
ncbi:MAG: hypothetical protein J0L84_01760 [Verrucomicrobia bacterium]|nr:hypothetical protein [Verrucomicrobiota bacterium]